MRKYILLFLFLILSFQSYAFTELGLNYSYDKSISGSKRENSSTTSSYGINVAFFFFGLTALELSVYQNKDETIINTEANTNNADYKISRAVSTIDSMVYQVGFRQAFAGRKSPVVPSLSLGYARQQSETQGTYTFRQVSTGNKTVESTDKSKYETNSMFATLGVKFNITQTLGLKGSVRSIFPAFEFNKAKDDLKYQLGISWIF